jgi:hypothetical protein
MQAVELLWCFSPNAKTSDLHDGLQRWEIIICIVYKSKPVTLELVHNVNT